MTFLSTATDAATINNLFESQVAHQYEIAKSTANERISKLKHLRKAILNHREALREAMWKEFKKPKTEVDLTEIYIITSTIDHAIKHLRQWMRPRRVDTPLALVGSSSWVRYEPKGVCLIIAPWNYPFNLTMSPLIYAIAAGNTAILKPSEFSPHTSAVMRNILEDVFEEKEIAMVEGAVETTTTLLDLPFNHIFFTGSPQVGKIVMKAASQHLASVTLELGGKSPTIVDETVDLDMAARRICWAKFSNAGQICLAPDYILVHESKKDAFLKKVKNTIQDFYGENPMAESSDFMRLIHERQFQRVRKMLEESVKMGAKVAIGGQSDASQNYLAPTVLTDVPLESPLMQEEIFGPIMPVLTYSNLDEVTSLVRSKEKPLTLYIYSKNKKTIERILDETRAGTSSINISNVHYSNTELPFGGSNFSGIGKSHGREGFEGFSNARGIFKQSFLPASVDLLMPPYGSKFKNWLVDFTLRWL